jgi:uncharacterized membrane protein YdjX (TVP38/TMEM64 family)
MDYKTIVSIIASLIAIAGGFINYYFQVKKSIAEAAPGAIDRAESLDKIGKEKFDNAVNYITELIPVVIKPFIPKSVIEKMIQGVFNKMESYAKKQEKDKIK